jgi:hypothetical protein
VSDYRSAAWSKLRTAIIMVSVIVPPIGLMVCTYNSVVTRYLARHVIVAEDRTEFEAGQIVAVTGVVRATPVRMPQDYPQFENALMVVWRMQEYEHGKNGGWKTREQVYWTSGDAAVGGWRLQYELIKHADFDWHRASPCTDYDPPKGWRAKCPGGQFAQRADDDDWRLSYEITPLPVEALTVIAMVSSDGSLGPVEHRLSALPANLVIWLYGNMDPQAFLAQRLAHNVRWVAIWAGVCVIVVWTHMYLVLRRDPFRRGPENVAGALWRTAMVVAPLAALAWPFQGRGFVAVALLSGLLSLTIGFVLWFRAAPDDVDAW